MNKRLARLLTAMCFMFSLGVNAQQINPITEAVMNDYAEILAENPKDYLTLYDRASQYFAMGEYARALSDIDMALEYTPEKDIDYLLAEYSLKSDILATQKNYEGAIEAVSQALKLNPVSQSDLYKAGNLYLLTNNPTEALKSFQALQRENPRSQEAFYGMAKANAMLGNNQEATSLIQQIESLGKQSYVTYCRIGDLYADMGNVKEAASNYIIAYNMEDSNARPIESLKLLSRKFPKEVMESIDAIALTNSDNVALKYVKAILAFDAGNYDLAEKACKDLAAEIDEESPAVYRMMAMTQLALNKLPEATENIKKAELLSPDNASMLENKAEILMSSDPQKAYEAAVKAVKLNPDDEVSLLLAAKAAMLSGKYQDALVLLNDVVLSNPGNGEALLLRGYLNTEFLNDAKAGIADYTRAGNINQDGSVGSLVHAALGKSKINKKLDADGLINEAINKAANNPSELYLIAMYFAQTGNLEKAKVFVDKALLNGYNNIYNLKVNKEPLFNLDPIRHLM